MQQKMIVVGLIALFLLASVFAIAGDKAEVKGMITGRTGETLIVNSPEGNTTVVLTDGTTTKDDKGLFGLGKQGMSNVVLIPGLKVDVEGVSDDKGRIVAQTITVDGDDLETAEMVQSGLTPTAEQVAANVEKIAAHGQDIETNRQDIAAAKSQFAAHVGASEQEIAAHKQRIDESMKDIDANTRRFTALSDYDVKGEGIVKFAIGSSKISDEDRGALTNLAQTATGLNGYIVEVTGFADSTGGAEMNTRLSEDRAKAVVAYLFQQCGVPMRHIVAPGAMGEYGPAAPNETEAGRAENRRVEVKILLNKGIAGN